MRQPPPSTAFRGPAGISTERPQWHSPHASSTTQHCTSRPQWRRPSGTAHMVPPTPVQRFVAP
eukprot:3044545-Pyramimonas_sp.AAC.1